MASTLWQFVFYVINNINIYPENGAPTLPDQVFGFYFGWAEVDMQKSFKVVVSIGWDHCSCISKRKFVSNQPLTGRIALFFMSSYVESYENSMR
jgi:hypothetical protein